MFKGVLEVFQKLFLWNRRRWLIVKMLRCIHAFMKHTNDDNLIGSKAVIGYMAIEV